MICSQDAIGLLAIRIEHAYRRRYPRWLAVGLTPGVWESAASRILEASERCPNIPIDPELYVAVQAPGGPTPNPWAELTQSRSLRRYLKSLRTIIGQLRKELKNEVQRAESRFLRGLTLDQVLAEEGSRISALTCYILAYRAGRHDLSVKHRAAAENQHRSCPLYRLASRSLLPGHAYPSADQAFTSLQFAAFSLN